MRGQASTGVWRGSGLVTGPPGFVPSAGVQPSFVGLGPPVPAADLLCMQLLKDQQGWARQTWLRLGVTVWLGHLLLDVSH